MSSTKLTLAVPEAAASTDVIQFKLVLGGEVIYPAHFFTAKKKKTINKALFLVTGRDSQNIWLVMKSNRLYFAHINKSVGCMKN